jgi:nitroimidazol reductase NimA-like FMN-containing flavoprotein (pyridoxamine 5'-phosphate oxidase superfamily)
MDDPSGPWSADETESFLTGTRIPIRLACRTPGGHLWILSLWYRFRDGRFRCATGADADVVRYLEADPDVAFEISTNDPPYRGVRGRGTATVAPDDDKEVLRALLERYLGETDSELARTLLSPDREEVRVEIDPAKLHTWDYTGRMRDATAED